MGKSRAHTRRIILANRQAPGDVLMLSAAVRDLHNCYPRTFVTDVRTPFPEIWNNNPFITPLERQSESDEVQILECHYPLIHESNTGSVHFLDGFIVYLNTHWGLNIELTAKRGDIYLSPQERHAPPAVTEWCGFRVPYWIIAAGGKWDYTIKWWDAKRWQKVVDHFVGRLLFVQVGARGHYHPKMEGTLDLRGRTSLRDLILLMYHADGVICPITCLRHFAAAVPRPRGREGVRPAVIVAGGREPLSWTHYDGQTVLHSIGDLSCCSTGGCWRARTTPIGDGDLKDRPEHLCRMPARIGKGASNRVSVHETLQDWKHARYNPPPHILPECMKRIESADVIEAIEQIIRNWRARFLTKGESKAAASGIERMEMLISKEYRRWDLQRRRNQ